jgi:capsular exopolysaccharide synthesis family protein
MMNDAMKKSAEEVLGFYIEKNLLIHEAVSHLAVKVHTYKSKYGKKSIVLTGCGTANGTTMISINLSVALARSGYKTLLIDADMRTRSKQMSRMSNIGLCDIIQGLYDGSEDIIKLTNVDGLHFLPSGNYTEDPALLLCSGQSAAFFGSISSEYDFVIIDCPAVTVVPEASALFMSVDGIILVCALNRTTKKQLQSAKNLIEPYSDKYYGLTVNSVAERQYKRLFPNHGYYLAKLKRGERKSRGKTK